MKSSMMQATHGGMIMKHARFYLTAKKTFYTDEISSSSKLCRSQRFCRNT